MYRIVIDELSVKIWRL